MNTLDKYMEKANKNGMETSDFAKRIHKAFDACNSAKMDVNDIKDIVAFNKKDISIRTFDSGASRNSEEGKLDFDGFLSPSVLKSYAEYMESMRYLEDGTLRSSDNWQKGIPKKEYMKSMWRHFFDVWTTRRDSYDTSKQKVSSKDKIEQLNALLFNVMGLLHEELKDA
jgi:hypothetical protein